MFGLLKQTSALSPKGLGLIKSFSVSAVQLKKRDHSLPVAPKGSASPYALFVKEWFPANKASHANSEGKIDLPTVSAAMSSAWQALTADNKQTYTERAKELKKTYDTEYKKWYTGLDAATIKAIEADTGKKVTPPGGRKGKQQEERNRPGNPGRPLTAFFEYMSEYRNGAGRELGVLDAAKKGGEAWRAMSEQDKQKYRDIAAEKKAKYLEWQKTLQ